MFLISNRAAVDAKNIIGQSINHLKMFPFSERVPIERLYWVTEPSGAEAHIEVTSGFQLSIRGWKCFIVVQPLTTCLFFHSLRYADTSNKTHTHAHSQIQISHMPGSQAIIQTAN